MVRICRRGKPLRHNALQSHTDATPSPRGSEPFVANHGAHSGQMWPRSKKWLADAQPSLAPAYRGVGNCGPVIPLVSRGPRRAELSDVIDAVGVVLCHSTLPGKDLVFLPHALLGPRDRGMMITGEGFHPVLVVGGALAQDFLAHHWNAEHLAEEVHHLLGPRQRAEVTVNDNAVEAVVNKRQEVAEQLDR